MLIYLKDENDLKALRIGLGYYFHNELAEKRAEYLNKLPPRDLLSIVSRFIRLIEQLDKEIEYYETTQ